MHAPARPQHARRLGRIAGKLQAEVALDRGVQLGRPARVNVPAAVGELPAADIIRQLGDPIRVGPAEDMKVKYVVGLDRGIRFKLAQPVSLLSLHRE